MVEVSQRPVEEDEALAWRARLALRIIRALAVIFGLSVLIILFSMHSSPGRDRMLFMSVIACAFMTLPAITARPRGSSRGWVIVIPALTMAYAGYAQLGTLSGPAACLTVTLMMAGLLLGYRAMVLLTAISAVVLTGVGWAMVTGRLPAPHPADISMSSANTWVRSVGVTFLALSVFGTMMIAVVGRMERSLRLARQETLRREQAERERADAELQAVESKQLEMVGRLAAGIAHDFNNNLTAIMGSAELLKSELPDDGLTRELSDGIVQASQRLAELTRQLLAYSRKARMQLHPTDLHQLIEQAVALLRRSTDPNITIVEDLKAQRSVVIGDAALLQSAVLNLLINARDAMPEGGRLTVGTTTLELTKTSSRGLPSGLCVVLEVLDTGHGIEPQQLQHIFDPFFTTKPIGKGTGLGLAAVAGTIKAHSGTVEVDSNPGGGSAFRIYLPCAEPEVPLPAPGSDVVVTGTGEILLVEDDAMVSATASATLQSFGYRVTHSATGRGAIEQVAAHPAKFQLVLLDLRMPGMGGEAVLDRLRELEPGLPVLIWSGFGVEQDTQRLLKKGAAGFIQKPYRIAALSRIVAANMRAPGRG